MKFYVGERVDVKINNVTNLGIFVNLDKKHHGLIYYKDFGDKWSSLKDKFEIGQDLRAVIVSVTNGKIGLSLNKVNDAELNDPKNPFNKEKQFVESLSSLLNHSDKKIKQLKTVLDK